MKQPFYFLSERPIERGHAGSKVRNDVEAVFQLAGGEAFEHIDEYDHPSHLRRALHRATPQYLAKMYHLHVFCGHTLILQYPFACDRISHYIYCRLVSQNRSILLVHDVEALRDMGRYSLEEELRIFRSAACLIVHNARMEAVLREHGVTVPVIKLGLFDYLLEAPLPARERRLAPAIAFAGNLEKSTFLHTSELGGIPMDMHLYGPNFSAGMIPGQRVHYHGTYPPNQIPYELEGSFGLVWDGDDITSCSGPYGQYLHYNNPHKFSLFIAACLPVITWREAAIAEVIEREGIGFCVDALTEIPERIAALSEETYQGYREHLRVLQQRVCTGFYVRRAVEQALARCDVCCDDICET